MTNASGRIIAGDVAMRMIMGELVLQWLFISNRQPDCIGRNCHGVELLCCNVIFYLLESSKFIYMIQCNATVLKLTWYSEKPLHLTSLQ